jgi:uncharacterized membrane protein YecN with MAPEG domain
MMSLPVVSILAAVFILMLAFLSLHVSMRRMYLGGIFFGDADDDILRRRIRAQGNFIEYVPTGLIALALMELARAATLQVAVLAIAFFISRVLHAYGMLYTKTASVGAVGMMIQHAVFIVSGNKNAGYRRMRPMLKMYLLF